MSARQRSDAATVVERVLAALLLFLFGGAGSSEGAAGAPGVRVGAPVPGLGRLASAPTLALGGRFVAGSERVQLARRYGEAPGDDPLVRRARLVFARVREGAQPRAAVPAELLVLAGPERPEAWALSDRTVVVNLAALRLCYGLPSARSGDGASAGLGAEASGVPALFGDARLAFVLAHELAHLEANDSWHAAAFSSIERDELLAELALESHDELLRREWAADRRGMEFTLIAGYPAAGLVVGDVDFFEQWDARLRALGQVDGGPHLSAERRNALIREQLLALDRDHDAFRIGTLLYALGRHQEAIRLLERFERRHASPEVRNNLGLAHLQAAAALLGACDGRAIARLRLPTRLASSTLEDRTVFRGDQRTDPASACRSNPEFREHVARGAAALEAAADQNPLDVPSRINLVSLHLLRGAASAAIEPTDHLVGLDAGRRGLASDDPDALVAGALALYQFGVDSGLSHTERALSLLDRALALDPRHPVALFDRGAILIEQGRAEESRIALEAFLGVEPAGFWAERARELLGRPPADRSDEDPVVLVSPAPPWPLGEASRRWTAAEPELQRISGLRLLVTDGTVQIVLQPRAEDAPFLDASGIAAVYGAPREELATSLGSILVYQGFGFELVAGASVSTFFFEAR